MIRITDLKPGAAGSRIVEHPAARLSPVARAAAVTTLLLGSGFQAASFLLFSVTDSRAGFARIAADPGPAQLAKLFDVLAMPFLVGGVAVYVLLGRRRSPRLAWIGGWLMAVGLIELTALQGWELLAYSLGEHRVLPPATLASAVDGLSSPAATAVVLTFLVGVVIGLPLTAVSLWRSRAVPRLAPVLLVTFLVIDLAGRGVAAHLVAFTAAVLIAGAVLRARPGRSGGTAHTPDRLSFRTAPPPRRGGRRAARPGTVAGRGR